jgi:hypothetical protein
MVEIDDLHVALVGGDVRPESVERSLDPVENLKGIHKPKGSNPSLRWKASGTIFGATENARKLSC